MPDQSFNDKMNARIKEMFEVDRLLWYDYETFSKCDLKACGAPVYSRHPSTELMIGAYAFDNQDVNIWDIYAHDVGDFDTPVDPPEEFLEALDDPSVLKIAWNQAFDWTISNEVLERFIPFDQQMDPMIHAYYLSFPGQLGKVGGLIGLPEDKQKDKDGKRLINLFTKPCKPTKTMPDRVRHWPWAKPVDWTKFRNYAGQDVASMRDITHRMWKFPMPYHLWVEWFEDRGINERGIPINPEMAKAACVMYDDYMEENLARMHDLTGLANPNSRPQLLGWLERTGEYVFDNLRKPSIAATLREEHLLPKSPDVREVLALRRETSKTSATKYRKFRDGACPDNTIKQQIQFGGAQRTFRWGGRGVQPHNIKKPRDEIAEMMPQMADLVEHGTRDDLELLFGDAMAVLSETIRGTIQAPPGHVIVDADLSAIENVVLGWSSQDQKILSVARSGDDPYLSFGQYFYETSYEALMHEFKVEKVKKKRTVCKPAVLGCGYRLGAGHRYIDDKSGEEEATGLLGYAKAMGIELTDDEAKRSVKIWRATYSEAVQFWYDLEQAAMHTLRTGQPTECGPVSFDVKGKFLRLRLPSGRHLHYFKASIKTIKAPWSKEGEPPKWIENICYWGLKDGRWCLQTTHGGKITENICQAIARDILQHGISLALKEGLDVFLHVHDQILALCRAEDGDDVLKLLEWCMRQTPSWASDIPLSTGGLVTTHFTKD